MRRRLTALMIICLAFLFFGCAKQEQASSAASPQTLDDYRSWTKIDWENATDSEKTDVARLVLFEFGDTFLEDFSDLIEEAEADPQIEARIEESLQGLKTSISDYYTSAGPDATLEELIQEGHSFMP